MRPSYGKVNKSKLRPTKCKVNESKMNMATPQAHNPHKKNGQLWVWLQPLLNKDDPTIMH